MALVRTSRRRWDHPRKVDAFLPECRPDRQPFCVVKATDRLVVNRPALSAKQAVQATVTVADSNGRQQT